MPSPPGQFRPEPPIVPDLSLSAHPARATARRPPPSVERRPLPGEPVGTDQRRRRIGTFGLAVGAAWAFPLTSPARFSRSVSKPRAGWTPDAAWSEAPSQLIPEGVPASGFDIVYANFDASCRRFSCARLSRSCLPGSKSRRFRTAHDPPWLWTTAARDGLGSAPDHRTRRALLHLQYNYATPCGPAMLVRQGTRSPCVSDPSMSAAWGTSTVAEAVGT